jgi:hypothetical protein
MCLRLRRFTAPLRLRDSVECKMRNLKREFLIALALCAIIILLIIVTTDSAPQWIYQGF